jgi:hypothetical protein
MSAAPSRLNATYFRLPLLHALGTLTDYRPGTPVHMDDVYCKVLELTGVNPDDYGIQKSSGMPWVRRWVLWAFRNQQAKPAYERKFNKGQPGYTVSMGRRQWALNKRGVQLAREQRSQFPGYNWSSEWLGEQLATTNLYERLRIHLSQKLSISAASNRVDDHIQAYLADTIAGDKLARQLQSGHPPTPRKVCEYAARHAYSALRQDGQDAHMRSLFGASTARDREVDLDGELVPRDPSSFTLPVDTRVVSATVGRDGEPGTTTSAGPTVGPLLDVVDDAATEDAWIDQMITSAAIARCKEVLRKRKPGAHGRYADQVLEAYRLGYSTADLAACPSEERPLGQGVSHNRAATLWAEMRRTLRDAIEDGDLDDVREMLFDAAMQETDPEILEAYRLGRTTGDGQADALDNAVPIGDVEDSNFFSAGLFSS